MTKSGDHKSERFLSIEQSAMKGDCDSAFRHLEEDGQFRKYGFPVHLVSEEQATFEINEGIGVRRRLSDSIKQSRNRDQFSLEAFHIIYRGYIYGRYSSARVGGAIVRTHDNGNGEKGAIFGHIELGETYRNLGLGKLAYVATQLMLPDGYRLTSASPREPEATYVWESLARYGLAEHIDSSQTDQINSTNNDHYSMLDVQL